MADEKNNDILQTAQDKVIVKKQPGYKRFFKAIAQEDGATLKDYILMDVIVPAIKRGIEDVVHVWLFGNGSRRSDYDRVSTKSTVSYRSYYDDRSPKSRILSTGYNYNELIFPSRLKAEEIIADMDAYLEQYNNLSVADYYDIVREKFPMSNITTNYTDNNYGWTDIRNARVINVDEGYMIKLPRAIPIN